MGKSSVESKLRDVEEFLEKIQKALRNHPDQKLARLSREASDAADDVQQAKNDLHSHWDED